MTDDDPLKRTPAVELDRDNRARLSGTKAGEHLKDTLDAIALEVARRAMKEIVEREAALIETGEIIRHSVNRVMADYFLGEWKP